MTDFQLIGLPGERFAPLFALDDATLLPQGIVRRIADAEFGYPCRVSLQDARPGEELLLLSYPHLEAASPYRASGPIFVRRHARQALLAPGEVPEYVARRLISLRAYDRACRMSEAQVCAGTEIAPHLRRMLASDEVDFVHLHNATRGCYSCLARRAPT